MSMTIIILLPSPYPIMTHLHLLHHLIAKGAHPRGDGDVKSLTGLVEAVHRIKGRPLVQCLEGYIRPAFNQEESILGTRLKELLQHRWIFGLYVLQFDGLEWMIIPLIYPHSPQNES